MTTQEQLKEKIVAHYQTASCDSYGQLDIISVHSIAKTEEEVSELSNLVSVSTYGGRYGTYRAFDPWGTFKCPELESRCKAAFAKNESRIRNVNTW